METSEGPDIVDAHNMETSRSTLSTMRFPILLFVVQLSFFLQIEAQLPTQCVLSETNRAPVDSDIMVKCGTEFIDLSIYICPIYNSNYNSSLMVLNHQDKLECKGTANWTAVPPVLQFRIPLNESQPASCNSVYTVTDEQGVGQLSDVSKVQSINVSGVVISMDTSSTVISYNSMIHYKFSCYYPMLYVLNNTKVNVSGADEAVQLNYSSFISTLDLNLYADSDFLNPLIIPIEGLDLKTKIYVKVVATNLTDRFNVILDRCYTSTGAYGTGATYDLFVGCTRDAQTFIISNGVSQVATFSFEAFRFVVHQNQTVSVFYLHCITRLCDVDTCQSLLPNCNATDIAQRRKRDTSPKEGVSTNTTVTSSPIVVKEIKDSPSTSYYDSSDAMGLVAPVVFTWTMMFLSLGATLSLTTET